MTSLSPGGASVPEPPAGREGPPGAVGQHQPQPAELRPVPQGLLRQRVRRLCTHQHATLPVAHLTAFEVVSMSNQQNVCVGGESCCLLAQKCKCMLWILLLSPVKIPEHVNMPSDSVSEIPTVIVIPLLSLSCSETISMASLH